MTAPIERRQITVDVPWQTEVGAKRLARQSRSSLSDYITGLIEAQLEDEAHRLREQFAEEERELLSLKAQDKEGEK